jgi:flagellar hook-associated protein 3 FlgL
MDLTVPSSAQQYLTGLANLQTQLTKAQYQVSSGKRLQTVADDPSAVVQIYRYQAQIAATQQRATNLSSASNEVSTADTALQSAINDVQSAISAAAEGANSIQTAQDRLNIAQQVSGVLESLVGISQTQANGKYIFSGDLESQPSYQVDPTQPTGVKQLNSAASTRTILDPNGIPIAVAKTAQEIFDQRDASGQPTANNVFAAVNSLLVGLQNNDTTAITNAAGDLQSASDYLNQQLAFYGNAENRLSTASDLAQKFLTSQQTALGQVQDADIPTAALALTQATTEQQAALSVEAKIQQEPTLFSYLG